MAVLNIGTSLTIGTELDWNVLRDSINYAYARNEAMRIRFTRDKDGECYQYIADVDEDFKERTVDFKDFTDVTMEEAENEMQGWTQVPFEFEDSPMTKIVMIKMPDGFNGVYFLGHHMVVDAQSLIAFLKDIIEIYCNAMYEGVPFPKDMCSYIEQLKKDLAYEAGSKATPPTGTASSTPSTTWTARRWRKVQSMKCDKKGLLLYAVTDRSWLNGETLYSQVEKALQGGATFIQLREKNLDQDHFMEEALELKKLCAAYHVPFVINDNVEIAAKMDADGVHVGQSDMEAGDVRAKLGPDKIIGVSAQTVEQAILAEQRGADYLGVGAVFHTGSKADAEDVSHETLTAICNAVKIPVIAIGGITRDNVTELSGSGICGIAVISAIFAQKDIVSATKDLKEQTLRMLENK